MERKEKKTKAKKKKRKKVSFTREEEVRMFPYVEQALFDGLPPYRAFLDAQAKVLHPSRHRPLKANASIAGAMQRFRRWAKDRDAASDPFDSPETTANHDQEGQFRSKVREGLKKIVHQELEKLLDELA